MHRRHIALAALTCVAASLTTYADQTFHTDPISRTHDGATVGQSQLMRSENRVMATLRTTDLDPGSAVTVWWRIYNRPQHCAVPYGCEASDLDNPLVDGSQLHATSALVESASGSATVVAVLYRTAAKAQGGAALADTLIEGHLKGRGLRRPMNAELELLIASHGRVANPNVDGDDIAATQLSTPTGAQLDCRVAGVEDAARTFRCGVLQKVDHAGL